MKVIAINGSPRNNWNTAILLKQALEGAASEGAEVEIINLYEYNYKGCISCFACKRKGGKSYGKCAVNDDLKPIFERIEKADALIVGSPIYLGMITGEMRSFLERLTFPYLAYDGNYSSLNKNPIPVGLIYTMNAGETALESAGYKQMFFKTVEFPLKTTFGETEALFVTDTYQFDDYSKYESSAFDAEKKAKRREEIFPEDCKKAYDMGYRFAKQ